MSAKSLRKTWGGLLAAVTVMGLVGPVRAQTKDDAEHFAQSLSLPRIYRDMFALQRIADEHGGHRASGHSGHEASADYIEQQLSGLPLRVWREPFSFTEHHWDAALRLWNSDGESFSASMGGDVSTPSEGLTGRLAVPRDEFGCMSDAWSGQDMIGQLALVRYDFRPGCSPSTQARLAQAAGAQALVIVNAGMAGENVQEVPVVRLNDTAQSERLWQLAQTGQIVVWLKTRYEATQRESFNLLAETLHGPADAVLMLEAHLDSVLGGPGVDDNASGSATVLEVARQAAAPPMAHRLRFAWWGAEEQGMLGSAEYLRRLPPNARRSLRGYFNADMLASPNYVMAVYDPTTFTGGELPAAAFQFQRSILAYFDNRSLPRLGMPYEMFSDHLNFIHCGIAVAGVSSFTPNAKTPEEQKQFGGQVGQSKNPHYHKATDRLANTAPAAHMWLSQALAYGFWSAAGNAGLPASPGTCRGTESGRLRHRDHQYLNQ